MTSEERIERLERIINQREIRIGAGWATIIWSMIGGLVAGAFFIAQLAAAQASLARTVSTLEERMEVHSNLQGHPAEIERLEAIKERVDRLDRAPH